MLKDLEFAFTSSRHNFGVFGNIMIDNKKDASIKKDRAILDFTFSATNDLDFFEERINYRVWSVLKNFAINAPVA